ncbi:hypothetical protein GCM10007973_09990 [Polymorphobacter multimanifer]|uniref:NnrU family protein n=1 Tax=Polymorphobacter multimanifer TaxID=1070431 RepID=UPI001662C73E|nr:NnrU family protein [Polymorphobacter multimanifer]GGI75156.1 hypothetical protein GCM10007973_09990 [Polymorphobacter multimanifer]
MGDLGLLIVAVSLFVRGHELLSHPLRAPLVRAVGEKGFLGIYAVVALGSLFWAVELWKDVPPDRLWEAPGWAYLAALPVMLLAFILFVGSVTAPNPALMGGGVPGAAGVRGVQNITRHPMMWSFALWAVVHMVLSADSRTLVLAGGILVLALFGSAMQDGKKRAADPGYGAHMARTSFVPFAAQLSGRAPLASAWPGAVASGGGLLLWAVVLWAHPLVLGVPALQLAR